MTIDRVTLNDPEARSADPVAANVAALKALFPAAVADGRLDFDALRQLLGDEVDDGDERYGLNWPGKRRARRLALTPSTGTLRPAREDSLDWDTTRNLMIEGDNLEVLKLLQKSLPRKVKAIFIDPPYNTGNDFVYEDDYTDNLNAYFAKSGQADEHGIPTTTNPESSGRFHTAWLNMMMPRLMLARNLLTDTGVIFVSIGDTEIGNLRLLMNEVFGEENFLATVAWQKKYAISADAKGIPLMHDHIVVFQKGGDFVPGLLPRSQKQDSLYSNKDNDPRGEWASDNLLRSEFRERDQYVIRSPRTGREHTPPAGSSWRHPQRQVEEMIADNRIWFGSDGNGVPRIKRFLSEVKQGVVISGWWPHAEVGHNDEAKKEIKNLIAEDVFQTPKPTRLIDRVFQLANVADGDIILDFFAGSGSTADALMKRNANAGSSVRYILVQIPEALDEEVKTQSNAAKLLKRLGKPLNIAELTKERLRRAAAKVKANQPETQADLGFRVYKLATSNLHAWKPGEDLAADLLAAADNIVQGRTEDDLLTELLLKQGIDLTEPMLTETIAGTPVYAMGGGVLVVCLAPVTAANAEALADGIADWIVQLNPVAATTVFFKDVGFESDVAKANVAAILEQRLEDQLLKVRSL